MRVVIFSGTTEGRELSRDLAAAGVSVTVCVATDYGQELQGECPGIEVRTGRLEEDGMVSVLQGADLCVDATHPYAREVSRNIRSAAQRAEVPLRRLLRPASPLPDGSVTVADAHEAAAWLADHPGNVLLTTGSKELSVYAPLGGDRLFPRVLPSVASLTLCQEAGIPRKNIIALQGPFSRELNLALIRQYQISCLVTKDGGAAGGFPEKAEAAREAGIPLVVLRRPEEPQEQEADAAAILLYCRRSVKTDSAPQNRISVGGSSTAPYHALDLARWFIARNNISVDLQGGSPLSLQKTHKLLYYAEGCSLALENGSLFSEPILGGEYGPVVDEVSRHYTECDPFCLPLDDNPGSEDMVSVEAVQNNHAVADLLDQVFTVFGKYSAWALTDMVLKEDPWREATDNGRHLHRELSRDTMKRYFAEHFCK